MHLYRAVKTCSYCGKENSDVSRHCERCGLRLEDEEIRRPYEDLSVEEHRQIAFRNAAKKLSLRRCSCGVSMLPCSARGTFARFSGAAYSMFVSYECPKCRHRVEIPSTSTFVIYGAFSLFFLWQSVQVTSQQKQASFKDSAILFLIFLSPGLLTAGLMLRGWLRRRKHPSIRIQE